MQGAPVLLAELEQQPQAGLQTIQAFSLMQAPDQPAGHAQILGLVAQQSLALVTHLVPVDGLGLVHGGGLFQLAFEGFEFAGITHVVTGEVPIVNGCFRQLQIMLGQG